MKKPETKASIKDGKCSGLKTRDALLGAAKELFAALGFDGVTVSAICKKAGISGTQVHYHFKDKAQLYRAVISLVGEGEFERLSKLLKPASTALEFQLRLELFATEYLAWRTRDALAFRILNFEYLRGMPIAKDVMEAKFELMRSTLENYFSLAQQTKVVRQDCDVCVLSTSFFGALNSIVDYHSLDKEGRGRSLSNDEDRARIASEFIKTLFIGLQATHPEEPHAA